MEGLATWRDAAGPHPRHAALRRQLLPAAADDVRRVPPRRWLTAAAPPPGCHAGVKRQILSPYRPGVRHGGTARPSSHRRTIRTPGVDAEITKCNQRYAKGKKMTARPDPTFYASAKLAMEAPAGNLCLHADAQPRFLAARRARRRRRRSEVVRLRQDRPHGDDAQQGRRVSPLRLERLLLGALADVGPRLPRAPLPDHPGHALVADLRDRHQAAPDAGEDPQDHRARGSLPQDRLLAPAHHPLRPGRHLRLDPRRRRQGRHRRPARHLHHGLRDLRRHRPLGDRPRAAGQALRLLVEPAARLHGLERMGAAAAVRERHRPRGPARATSTATACTSGTCAPAATSRPSTSAPTTRWRSRSGRRTTRSRNTASSASSSTPPTSKARSGPGGARTARSTARRPPTIPPEPAEKDLLPPLLQGFGAVPPLVTDIDLSLDDRFLYVSCWGTGEMRQYDVSDPRKPKLAGSVHIGGIARRTAHPNGKPYRGGPQMVEISRDGKRVYWTNSLYSTWDAQFYPAGVPGAMVKADVGAGRRPDARQGLLGRVPGGLPPAPDPARRRRLLDGLLLLSLRLTLGHRAMDHGRPLAGRGRQRPLPRRQSRHGLAAGGVGRR